MASATGPGKHLVSQEEEGRSPLGVGALSLAQASTSQADEENAHGEVYRAGRACVKLHAGGGGPERKAAGLDGEAVRAGTLWSADRPGRASFTFQYDDAWPTDARSLELDPELLLVPGRKVAAPHLFGGLADSAPDRWGRVSDARWRRSERKLCVGSPSAVWRRIAFSSAASLR